jgi:hypothetical protein
VSGSAEAVDVVNGSSMGVAPVGLAIEVMAVVYDDYSGDCGSIWLIKVIVCTDYRTAGSEGPSDPKRSGVKELT